MPTWNSSNIEIFPTVLSESLFGIGAFSEGPLWGTLVSSSWGVIPCFLLLLSLALSFLSSPPAPWEAGDPLGGAGK